MHLDHIHPRPSAVAGSAVDVRLLDWGVALGGLWLTAGVHLDGWAHRHVRMETFFTPWHAALYSGFLVTAAVVGLAFLYNLRLGKSWRTALPPAYRTSLLGAVLFLFAGLGDMTWHTLFGIEVSLEALLSPPHLALALGAGLLVTGPLRAALYRPGQRSDTPGLPALLSLINLVALLAFFTAYVHPFIEASRPASPGSLRSILVSSSQPHLVGAVLLQTVLLMGAVLLLVSCCAARRFRPPFGSLTLLFTLTTFFAVSMTENWGLLLIGLLGGLAADGLALLLHPGVSSTGTRLFAFLVPTLLYLFYFANFILQGQLEWSLELWTGTLLLSGFTGWLLSYAFVPPEPVQ